MGSPISKLYPIAPPSMLLLKIEISLVVNFRSITNQNELKF
jgi:hypothetical protein